MSPKSGSPRDKLKVLIADDAPDLVGRFVEWLSELDGVEVVGPAYDGVQALELFEAERPHAAVLDLNMPRKSGLDVLRALRASGHRCVVIMLTGETERTLLERCRAEGADHVLSKASDFERVIDLVAGYAAQSCDS